MRISSLLNMPLLLIFFFILLPNFINGGRHLGCRNHSVSDSGHTHGSLGRKTEYVAFMQKKEKKGGRVVVRRAPATLQVAGSSLPDCSHACGSCSPCRLVMVSFICEEEAETCPMAYKCMCNRKSYPVP